MEVIPGVRDFREPGSVLGRRRRGDCERCNSRTRRYIGAGPRRSNYRKGETKWVPCLMIFHVAWLARCRGVKFSGTSRAGFLALLLCQLWELYQHGRPAHRDNSFATANSRLAVPVDPRAAGKELAKTTAVLQHIRAAQRRAASQGIRAPLAVSV